MEQRLSIIDKIILSPLWLVTLLPLRILFGFSDFLYLILYYLVGYRKKVVFENLQKAFPDKNKDEILLIARRFYRYLCDYFIESIYLINMSLKECNRRYEFINIELLQRLYNEGKSVVLASTHYGNWEWSINISILSPYTMYGVYKPLHNKLFDRLFIHIRSKFVSVPVPIKKSTRTLHTLLKNNEPIIFYLIGDQRPPKGDLEYWTTFLNQETPVITGMDKIARKYNLPVIFMNVHRPKRGYYKVTLEIISNKPDALQPYTIIEKYIRNVEKLIHSKPEYWLWSHKRFKYKPEEYKPKPVS